MLFEQLFTCLWADKKSHRSPEKKDFSFYFKSYIHIYFYEQTSYYVQNVCTYYVRLTKYKICKFLSHWMVKSEIIIFFLQNILKGKEAEGSNSCGVK